MICDFLLWFSNSIRSSSDFIVQFLKMPWLSSSSVYCKIWRVMLAIVVNVNGQIPRTAAVPFSMNEKLRTDKIYQSLKLYLKTINLLMFFVLLLFSVNGSRCFKNMNEKWKLIIFRFCFVMWRSHQLSANKNRKLLHRKIYEMKLYSNHLIFSNKFNGNKYWSYEQLFGLQKKQKI